jgi:hypothetical protein
MVRWHRKGFTAYWRWKSRSRGGHPRIAQEVRDRRMWCRWLYHQNASLEATVCTVGTVS